MHVPWSEVESVTSVVQLKRPAAELRLNRGDERWAAAHPQAARVLMRLSELLNRRVLTESGQSLGRVHDVRGELAGGRLRITGLAAGELGLLERFGVGTHGSGGPRQAKVHGHHVIPWERVVRVGAEIVVRDSEGE